MKRPEISIDNTEQVYDYYANFKPNFFLNRIGHLAMSLMYKPDVHYEEDAINSLDELMKNNYRIIIAPNHVNDIDQYTVASAAQREKPLKKLRRNTFVLAKSSIFTEEGKFISWGVDQMNAMPVFRIVDIPENDEDREIKLQSQSKCKEKMLSTSIYRIDNGENMAIFTESTRNKIDVTKVQRIKPGLDMIIRGLKPDTKVAILPFGIYYGENKNKDLKKPTLFIGKPSEQNSRNPGEVTEFLQERIQECVDNAIKIRSEVILTN